jgi:hypothetical protein
VTFIINDIMCSNTQRLVSFHHFTEYLTFYAACHYDECRCAECCGAVYVSTMDVCLDKTLADRTKPGLSFQL